MFAIGFALALLFMLATYTVGRAAMTMALYGIGLWMVGTLLGWDKFIGIMVVVFGIPAAVVLGLVLGNGRWRPPTP